LFEKGLLGVYFKSSPLVRRGLRTKNKSKRS
jgi:hypothetical protein